MKRTLLLSVLLATLVLGLSACGSGDSNGDSASSTSSESGLSQAELEKGIGPIDNVELSASIDDALAAQGQEIFTIKCSACHKMNDRYVGPALGDVLSRRTPEYAMNMMLNPAEMVQKHPEARAMLAQYATPMPDQNLTEDDARAILEYLRANQTDGADAAQ